MYVESSFPYENQYKSLTIDMGTKNFNDLYWFLLTYKDEYKSLTINNYYKSIKIYIRLTSNIGGFFWINMYVPDTFSWIERRLPTR